MAVSYTHLDVYKRQVWARGGAPRRQGRRVAGDLFGGADFRSRRLGPTGKKENRGDRKPVRARPCRWGRARDARKRKAVAGRFRADARQRSPEEMFFQ